MTARQQTGHRSDPLALQGVEARLRGRRSHSVALELLSNSIHFPLANIILELLIEGFSDYVFEPDFYTLILACLVQAWWLGSRQYEGRPSPFLGNLIGPAVYTLIEVALEGAAFWQSPNHIAYWVFAFLVGGLQQLQLWLPQGLRLYALLAEHLTRTSILLVMYIIFEIHDAPSLEGVMHFFSDDSHLFVSIVIVLLGLIVGFSYWTAQRYLQTLQVTADQLKVYSEWLLGRDLLDQAVGNQKVLGLSRKKRAVLFMDIRGFTAWSERQSPEQVVSMLNACFAAAEPVSDRFKAIKVKHTGDEIMAVFDRPVRAVAAGKELRALLTELLEGYGLTVGAGIHYGELVEGLIGGEKVRSYDIIGDTVNTAKRLCDAALGGELLLSQAVVNEAARDDDIFFGNLPAIYRDISMKGKQDPIQVRVI